MEGANVLALALQTYKTTEVFDDRQKWAKASIVPMQMSTGNILGFDNCLSLEEKLISPRL